MIQFDFNSLLKTMDIGNAELHEAMVEEIKFKKIIKELEK